MNRRNFLKSTAAVGVGSLVAFPLVGCDSSNVTNILNTVLNSAEAVLAVAEPNAPWAQQFRDAVTALQAAETQWKAGSAVTIVIAALNTLAAVAAVIPFTATYSPLIDILVAGIDAVLTAIGTGSTPALAGRNARVGRVILKKPHVFQNEVGAYKAQWNEVVATHPGLSPAKLK